jgi:hypothetical protein
LFRNVIRYSRKRKIRNKICEVIVLMMMGAEGEINKGIKGK